MLSSVKSLIERERWIAPVVCIVAFELLLAFVVGRHLGHVAPPPIDGYTIVATRLLPISISFFILWQIFALKWAERPTKALIEKCKKNADLVIPLAIGATLVLAQKMALTWVKPALGKTGFWADPMLADAERSLLGADAWQYAHWLLGPSNDVIDWVYTLWFPVILTVFFFVLVSRHELKSRVIITYFLAVAAGIVLQFALPSGGPIFYSRLGFGDQFVALLSAMPERALASSVYLMWHHIGFDRGGIAIGISAWPSIHITTATWVVLAAWALKSRLLPLAVIWWTVMLVGSVYLGWHYLLDGIAGVAIAYLCWAVQGRPFALPVRRFALAPMKSPRGANGGGIVERD